MHVFLAEGAKHQQLMKWLGNPLLRSAEPGTYLRCYGSTLQMQIFWQWRRVWTIFLGCSFTTKSRYRSRKWVISVDHSACQEAHGFGFLAGYFGCCCCYGQGRWVCKGSCYLPKITWINIKHYCCVVYHQAQTPGPSGWLIAVLYLPEFSWQE